MDEIFKLIDERTPTIFILSPGADPYGKAYAHAKILGKENQFKVVSLGEGMQPKARDYINEGVHRGHWVMLQNCDLLIPFIKEIDKILDSKQNKNPHKEFRLFLTTNPHDDFPLSLLQRSFKVVEEPPDGLKLNIRSTWSKLAQTDLDKSLSKDFKPLVYVISF